MDEYGIEAFKDRLTRAMSLRDIRPIDLANLTKIPKSGISQYMSGRAQPGQKKLYILSKALNVSEAWLMGYNVPMERLTPAGRDHVKYIPLVGTVACGNPIYAESNIQEYVTVSEDDRVDFALTAKGDSMNNAKISDGDILYVHSQPEVQNGEIAVVLIDDEATVKRFYDYGDKIVLRPDSFNPVHKEMIYQKDQSSPMIQVQGKVIFAKAYIN